MPRRDSELPEGTDQITSGAPDDGKTKEGFVAKGASARGATDKLVTQMREQVVSLRGQAGDKLRTVADDGKGKATNLLDELGGVIEDAARSIDERLGNEYGDYAHRAADAVSTFAGRVRERTVDDLLDDTRDIVRRSPAVAIAAAAVVGFALMRVIRTGLDDAGGRSNKRSRNRRPNVDTTTGGGA